MSPLILCVQFKRCKRQIEDGEESHGGVPEDFLGIVPLARNRPRLSFDAYQKMLIMGQALASFRSVSKSLSISTGLERCAVMPACRER